MDREKKGGHPARERRNGKFGSFPLKTPSAKNTPENREGGKFCCFFWGRYGCFPPHVIPKGWGVTIQGFLLINLNNIFHTIGVNPLRFFFYLTPPSYLFLKGGKNSIRGNKKWRNPTCSSFPQNRRTWWYQKCNQKPREKKVSPPRKLPIFLGGRLIFFKTPQPGGNGDWGYILEKLGTPPDRTRKGPTSGRTP